MLYIYIYIFYISKTSIDREIKEELNGKNPNILRLKRCAINKIIQIFKPKNFFLCHLVNFPIGGYFNINCKLIEKQRHKNVSMYTFRVSLTKSEQVFLCCNQLNSFNGTFPFVIFKVLSNDFKVFLSQIIIMFLNAVFKRLVISSIVVFNGFMDATCSFTDVIVFTCWYRTVHMIYQVMLVFKICFVSDVKLGTYFLSTATLTSLGLVL